MNGQTNVWNDVFGWTNVLKDMFGQSNVSMTLALTCSKKQGDEKTVKKIQYMYLAVMNSNIFCNKMQFSSLLQSSVNSTHICRFTLTFFAKKSSNLFNYCKVQ